MPDLDATVLQLDRSQTDRAPTWVDDTTDDAPTEEIALTGDGGRYVQLSLLGTGGMGEVYRVLDRDLNRVMAMKVIRPDLATHNMASARFVEEAQATAQLDHPGIVPVHELGRLPDGRLYFTMREVQGRTLRSAIEELRTASVGTWRPCADGLTLRRMIETLRRACEAVAYAHARGVVHRDLKPDNIMVGAFGEVLVLDWGIAKVLGRIESSTERAPIITVRSHDASMCTRMGAVAGTPSFMSPEQAAGETDRIGPATDVYALGAILSTLLRGRTPSGQFIGPARDLPIPVGLRRIADHAMRTEPANRYPDAAALERELGGWLEGARRRDEALELVGKARGVAPEGERMRARATQHRSDAEALLATLPSHAPVAQKRPAWRLQDEAATLERLAALKDVDVVRLLMAALARDPDLIEAHDALADHYRGHHAAAEARHDDAATARYEALLRGHDRGRYSGWLRGTGRLTLTSEVPATVRLSRFENRDRRLVPRVVRELGATPLAEELPHGSWLLELRAEGRATVRYPVTIGREEHWDPVDPEGNHHPVHLPAADSLGRDDVFIPAGWFETGGDDEAIGSLPRRRVWVDDFVMRRFAVTHREYLVFIRDLAARGEDWRRHAPRTPGTDDDALYTETDGVISTTLGLGQGVTMVDWFSARAYAAWEAERTGYAWRLPGDVEWEKAARGVDGRFFPWGNHLDATYACYQGSHEGHPAPPSVRSFKVDRSPYGVRGLGGGVRDWCQCAYERYGQPVVNGRVPVDASDDRPDVPRIERGGSWSHHQRLVRSATRWWQASASRWYDCGFRLVRPIEG
jgi:serine/threonine-protein kinase